MAAEDVVTDLPSMTAPATHPETEPSANALPRIPLPPTPSEEEDDDDPSLRGVIALDPPREVLFSVVLEFRTADLPRWKPRMDFDRPRALTDDE